jgi:tetratricopeptide (TPR) repeat protein
VCTAEAHLVWQRSSEALAETALALKASPKSYDAKVMEGRALALALKDKEAETALREAIAWRSDAPDAHYWLGRLLAGTHARQADAIAELRAAVKLDANDPDAAFALARAVGGAEGAQLLDVATRERPTFGDAWLALAQVSLELGRVADAKRAADAALRLLPSDVLANIASGRVALAEGRADDAIRAAEAALKLVTNSAKAKLLLADGYAKKGEIDIAIEHYQAAWGLDHGDPSALVHAAEACNAAGRFTSGKAFALRATQDFPSHAPAWAALGDALTGQKEPSAAKAAYEKALKGEGTIDRASVEKKMAALK